MRILGQVTLNENGRIVNLTAPIGSTFPTQTTEGELFILSGHSSLPDGLYYYQNGGWVQSSDTNTSLVRSFNYTNDNDSTAGVVERAYSLIGMAENNHYKVLTIGTTYASQNILIEMLITDTWGSGVASSAVERVTFAIIKGGASNTTSVSVLEHVRVNNATGEARGLTEPVVTGGQVVFGYRSGNNGTATTNQGIRVKINILGATSNVTYHQSPEVATTSPFLYGSTVVTYINNKFAPTSNGVHNLGDPTHKWNQLYAATATINTSDANEKTSIDTLNLAELNVSKKLKSLVKKFKYKKAFQEKGDAARTHVGVIAQEVVQAFQEEGLDPFSYGFVCKDSWWELNGEIVPYNTPYAIEKTVLGIRYEELIMFILAS